jgi:hypothetical protein
MTSRRYAWWKPWAFVMVGTLVSAAVLSFVPDDWTTAVALGLGGVIGGYAQRWWPS